MIEHHATTQGKLGYLTDNTAALGSQDSQFGKWKIADDACQVTHLKQGGHPISTYFAELKTIWLEQDKRRPFQMKCTNDMKIFQANVMTDRVYDFLAGLDDTYDKVRSDILRSYKVPSIENVFFMISCKAQRQITMLGFSTKPGELAIMFASKNIALVS
ncbi:unnamed protein product [Prunus armeniaca]